MRSRRGLRTRLGGARPSQLEDCIVVIDDDEVVRELTCLTLRDAGFEVIDAEDGFRGFELIRARRPKVAIIDVFLPHLSGVEICEKIRNDSTFNGMFLLFMSAMYPAEDTLTMPRGQGPDMALEKPYEPSELVRIVRRAFAKPSASGFLGGASYGR